MLPDEMRDPASWFASEFSANLAAAIEMMAGTSPGAQPAPVAPDPASASLWITTPLTVAPGAAIVAGAPEECWNEIGRAALNAAGLTGNAADIQAAYREILSLAAAGFARSLSERFGRPISALPGVDGDPAGADGMCVIQLALAGGAAARELFFGWTAALATGFSPPVSAARPLPPQSRTLDLLMEVELPVSVSFGRAELALRDVLKLNSGSIVELNRTISDPVEIIVNNCVIARGEVVVVDGNYGVRIQQVISREERLRTLK